MGTRLHDYVHELRGRYDKEQSAQLDSAMRRYDLAGQLLSLRFANGFTQQRLAELSGISQADISRYERGLGNPTRTTIEALAGALHAHLELVPDSRLQSVTA